MINLFQLKPGETVWYPVLSGSMAPEFLPGDEVLVRILDPRDVTSIVHSGKITVFFREGKFFFHRVLIALFVIKLIYEKGDANNRGSWISTRRIVGIIENHRRGYYTLLSKSEMLKSTRSKVYKELLKVLFNVRIIRFLKRRFKNCINFFSR